MDLRYSAVGIQNQSRMALSRDDYMLDIERLATTIGFAVWNCSLDLPVRLVTVSEGGIGGWCLAGGEEHLRIYRDVVPEIPGKETEFLGEICRKHGISDATYYNWKSKYGGMEASDLKRMKELEGELSQYKRMYTELARENDAMRNLIAKKL